MSWADLFPAFPDTFRAAMVHPLWTGDTSSLGSNLYSALNLLEAVAWWAVALVVGRRALREQRAPLLEGIYVAAFVIFGLTDVIESRVVNLALIGGKGLNFALILVLRAMIRRGPYADRKPAF